MALPVPDFTFDLQISSWKRQEASLLYSRVWPRYKHLAPLLNVFRTYLQSSKQMPHVWQKEDAFLILFVRPNFCFWTFCETTDTSDCGFTFTQLMSNFVSVSKNMSWPRGLKIEACGSSTASKTTVQEVKERKNGSDLPHFHLCFTKLHVSEARVCFSELKGLIWSISRTALFQCCCPRSHLSGKG